jgi:hypothetical protein
VDLLIDEAMDGFAAVMVVGPRAVGKTTTAARHAAQIDRLDVPDVAATYRADPDAALKRAPRPLLIDEWQEVPEVLSAVKRAVDRDRSPGQFVLTGSIRADTDLSTWAGTGRVVRINMHALAEREIEGDVVHDGLISRLSTGWLDAFPRRLDEVSIDDYVRRACRGSFPELAYIDRLPRQRQLWLDSYIDDLVTRDVASIGAPRDPVRMRRYLAVLALHLAGQPSEATLLRDADINVKTAKAYDRALASLAVLDMVPAWASSRLKRLAKGPKRYLADTALAASVAGINEHDIIHDGDLRGRWFDAFAAAQLRPEFGLASPRMRPYHLRADGGRREVDLLVDVGGGKLFAVEFKAGAAPTREDARHLIWLRDQVGKDFIGGIVLHTGQAVVELDDRIGAGPLSAAWTPPDSAEAQSANSSVPAR